MQHPDALTLSRSTYRLTACRLADFVSSIQPDRLHVAHLRYRNVALDVVGESGDVDRVMEEGVGHLRLQDRLQLVEEGRPLFHVPGRARRFEQPVDLRVVVAVRVPWAFRMEEVPVAVVRVGVGDAAVGEPVKVAGQPALVPGSVLELLELNVEPDIAELVAKGLGEALRVGWWP